MKANIKDSIVQTFTSINSDKPESLIVALAKSGDQAAFASLVHRRQSWIRNLMRRCCGDAVLGDDLSQQVFLTAWQKIGQLKETNKFGPWLKSIAISTWLQYIRKNDPLWESGAPEDNIIQYSGDITLGVDLDKALATLSPAVRICIILSYHEGMTHSEISLQTDVPLGTVKSHILRGSKQLRDLLSDYEDPSIAKEAS